MPQVTTTCQKCGFAFSWFMGGAAEMPDCPQCGFNPISSQCDSGIDKLLKDLQSSDVNVRNNAAVFLGQKGEQRAIEPLLKMLEKEGSKVPVGVLGALGDLKVEKAIPMIVALMPENDRGPNPHMLGWGTRAIAQIGTEEALKVLVKNFRWILPRDLNEVVVPFIKLGDTAVLYFKEALEKYKDNWFAHNDIRKEIMWVLGRIGGSAAVELLKKHLKDKSSLVLSAAKDALLSLKWEPATEEEEILFAVAKGNTDEIKSRGQSVFKALVSVLMSDISRRSKKNIATLLEEMSWSPANDREKIEVAIAKGEIEELSELGPCAKDAMVNAMMDKSYDDRMKIPEVLVRIDAPGIYDLLLRAFKEDSLSQAAAKALGLLGDKRAVASLAEHLNSFWVDEDERCVYANALGDILDPSALGALEEASKGGSGKLEVAALSAVSKIKKAQQSGVD